MSEPSTGTRSGTLSAPAGTSTSAPADDVAAALRASEERRELAERATGVGVFDWDLATDRATWSAEIYRLHGIPPGTPPTTALWLAAVHPDDRAPIQAAVAALRDAAVEGTAVAPDALVENEYRVVLPDGAVRWMASRVRVIVGEGGRPGRLLGVNFDVTERRRTEAALRESEAHYRHTVELNPQIPWTADPEGRVLDFSQRWLDLTGLTREQTLGEGWRQAVHPDDLAPMAAAWGRSIRTGEPYDVEHRTRLADGTYRWVRVRAFPRRDGEGRIVRWYGTTEDVHDRWTAEEALRENEERFRLASEALAGFLYEVDPSTNRVTFYRGVDGVLGFPPAEAPPDVTWWRDRVHPDDVPHGARAWQAAVEGDAPGYVLEYRVRHRDGHYVDVIDRGRIVRDAAGGAVRVVGGTTDVSEHRRLERERAVLLERERAARRSADEANLAKARFLAATSHELRTPLNAILGYAQIVDMGVHGPVTAAQHDALERVMGAQEHLLTLINDILQFAKLEIGQVQLEIADVLLAEVCSRVEALVRPAVTAKRLTFTCDLGDPAGPAGAPLAVRADRDRMLQILVNLVTNAVRHTAEGGTVAADADADGARVHTHVRDTGRGIPGEELEAIFHPFVQVDRAGTSGEGVGLGLAISRDLARGMGGDVTVESAVGVGSTFTLSLPRAFPHAS